MGLANDLGSALNAFSGALVAQSNQQQVARHITPVTQANLVNEGLLGLVYDVATAPPSYAKGPSGIAATQALNSFQNEPTPDTEN